jgi:hypothetical protein
MEILIFETLHSASQIRTMERGPPVDKHWHTRCTLVPPLFASESAHVATDSFRPMYKGMLP